MLVLRNSSSANGGIHIKNQTCKAVLFLWKLLSSMLFEQAALNVGASFKISLAEPILPIACYEEGSRLLCASRGGQSARTAYTVTLDAERMK